MPAPQIIHDLIARFERNLDAYKSGGYNETQARREFIDPFFEALGWDVNNCDGNAEAYKDVIHEDAVKVGGITKAPDYSFRIGGQRKFFVEAKKPSICIKDDPAPAFQVRRYAWSAKLPLSIVTDFEEFAVYDCRIKPDQKDRADKARVKYYNFRQYGEKWDEIAAIFSKNAILKGSFDKYAESHKAKRGTAEVDSAFLEEIEGWRDTLARNIALRNSLSVRELNEAVQRTIDRIIFLRIAEDRGIEEYGSLRTICNGPNTFARLRELFYKADDRYNSGLFHFRAEKGESEPPDNLTGSLIIDDKPLKEILKRLYYPDSPYEFAVLPADILGQVYEQFLGKVIRLTSDHRAVVEDKPEVKKAGGVFYTPTYIVDYIVENTVGKLLEPPPTPSLSRRGPSTSPPILGGAGGGKLLTPAEAAKLRILDPACGSGSFLLGAYQYLLDWHLAWYVNNEPEKWATKGKNPPVCKTYHPPAPLGPQFGSSLVKEGVPDRAGVVGASYRLTTAERKRILLNNIYGVDIDSQAVEVTKLSLLLKVLEGETGETLNQQMRLFHERALPDLGSNIKCGNSLIGPDFYDNRQMSLMGDEEMYRVNVFDWQREFPEIFASTSSPRPLGEGGRRPGEGGGFDAVIGNPPYLGGRVWKEEDGRRYDYFVHKFEVAEYQFDIYALFWEKSIHLLNDNGVIGFITPNTWLNNQSNRKLRNFILNNTAIISITDYSRIQVFSKAVVLPIITILSKPYLPDHRVEIHQPEFEKMKFLHSIIQKIWMNDDQKIFNIDLREEDTWIREKIECSNVVLESLAQVKFGIKLYETGKGTPPQKASDAKDHIYESISQLDENYRKYLEGKDIQRYQILWQSRWLKYGRNLAAPRNPDLFEGNRLLVRRIVGERLICTFTDEPYVTSQLLQIVKPTDQGLSKFILGLLNSSLLAYYFKKKYNRQDKTFPEIRIYELASLPIRPIDFTKPADKASHDRMVQLVEQMLTLHKQLPAAKTGHDQTHLQRQIDATDRQIDKLVYELYGLTEEEIAVVEGKT